MKGLTFESLANQNDLRHRPGRRNRLYNLIEAGVPGMVHFEAQKVKYWLRVQLEAPEDAVAHKDTEK